MSDRSQEHTVPRKGPAAPVTRFAQRDQGECSGTGVFWVLSHMAESGQVRKLERWVKWTLWTLRGGFLPRLFVSESLSCQPGVAPHRGPDSDLQGSKRPFLTSVQMLVSEDPSRFRKQLEDAGKGRRPPSPEVRDGVKRR